MTSGFLWRALLVSHTLGQGADHEGHEKHDDERHEVTAVGNVERVSGGMKK
jgi:hypothetical protein